LLTSTVGLPVSAASHCFAPTGDWISGADLAAALPGLAGLPAALKVGYAPIPGLARVFHPDELRRLAHANGLADPAPGSTENICAAWPVAPLAPETLRRAMEKTLAGHAPQIELLTQDKAEAPAGEVVFPLSGLSAYSENPVIWKGYVRYSETRRFETWARVRVRVSQTQLKAQGAIHAGERVTAAQWRAEAYTGPPLRDVLLTGGSQLTGLVARRDFADGAPLSAIFFDQPKAVERGDVVTVIAGVGAAHVEAPGEALSSGACGDVILIRNPRSNRTFKARVASAGRVEVLPGTTVGLAGTDGSKGNSL
jgi:flagella basal body P-ring formation protein FlgA